MPHLLTINNGKSTDLASLVKTVQVRADELEVGDVVVDDCNVWQVARVTYTNGYPGLEPGQYAIGVYDADENGGVSLRDWLYTILDKSALIEGYKEERFYG